MESPRFPDIKGYTPVCLCGEGAYGQVWLVKDFSNRQLALKVVSKRALGGDWKREYNGLVTYRQKVKHHPNLINIYHIEDRDSFFYYTMECADNMCDDNEYIPSTLEHWVERFGKVGPETIVNIFDQLLDGVTALHEAGVIHRDIKPDNIIFVDRVPKLSDIGLITSMSQSISLVGTQPYVPPEVITGNAEAKESSSIDLYAMGKSIYRAFSGSTPDNFPKVDAETLADKQCKKLNKLVKIACHTTPYARFKNINSFRDALLKGVTFKTVLVSFWTFIASSISNMFLFPAVFFKALWRNNHSRNFLIILFIGLILYFCSGIWDKFYFKYLNHRQYYGLLTKEEYKTYNKMLIKANKERIERRKLEKKREYERELLELKSEASVEGFKDMEAVEIPRKYSLVYQENFKNFNHWRFKYKKNIVLGRKSMILGKNGSCDMLLKSILLPEDYEINITLTNEDDIRSLRFIVYNPNDLDIDHPDNPSSFIWGIDHNGNLENLKIKPFRGSSTFDKEIKPYDSILNNKKKGIICVIKKGSILRIYYNKKLIYKPTSLGHSFKVGSLRMKLRSSIELKDLSVYDITPKGFLGKITGNSFKDPDS